MATFSCFTPTKKMTEAARRYSLATATPVKTPAAAEKASELMNDVKTSPRLSLNFEVDATYRKNLLTDEDMKRFFQFKKSKSGRNLDIPDPAPIQDEAAALLNSEIEPEEPEGGLTFAEFLREDNALHPAEARHTAITLPKGRLGVRNETVTALPAAPTDLDLQAAAAIPLPKTPQSDQITPGTTPNQHKRKNISLSLPLRSAKRALTKRSASKDFHFHPVASLRRFQRRGEPEFIIQSPRDYQDTPATQRTRRTTTTISTRNASSSITGTAAERVSDPLPSTEQPDPNINKNLPVLSESTLNEINNYPGAPRFAPPLPIPTLPNIENMHASPANMFVRPRAPTRAELASHIDRLHRHIHNLNLENRVLRDQFSLVRRDWIETSSDLDVERHRNFEAGTERFKLEVRVEELEGTVRRLQRGSVL